MGDFCRPFGLVRASTLTSSVPIVGKLEKSSFGELETEEHLFHTRESRHKDLPYYLGQFYVLSMGNRVEKFHIKATDRLGGEYTIAIDYWSGCHEGGYGAFLKRDMTGHCDLGTRDSLSRQL